MGLDLQAMRTPDEIINEWDRGVLNRGELYAFLLEASTPENLPLIKARLGAGTILWREFEAIVKKDELPEAPTKVEPRTLWEKLCHWVRWG